MFNENWLALAVFSILLGLVLRDNSLLTVSALMLTVTGAGWLWNQYSLRGVGYRRLFSERRAFLGEVVDLTLQVTNRKWLPLPWLRVQDEYPTSIALLDGQVQPCTKPDRGLLSNLMSLRWLERVQVRYHLRCDKRGFYAFGPACLQSGDMFGLFDSQSVRPEVDWLIVYPEVRPIEGLILPPKELLGEAKAHQRIFGDPTRTAGTREHRAGDPLKSIHWKASARHQTLQVKVHEPTTTTQLVIFLDMATLPRPWQGTIPELLERGINVAASIASHAVAQRFQVGLQANGCWPRSDQELKVLPSRSPDQLLRILEALAAVSVQPIISIEELLHRESARLPWAASLFVITAVVTEELLVVIARLKASGRRVVLIRLDEGAPLPLQVNGLPVQRAIDAGSVFRFESEQMG